jgi:hypothetical protein
MLPWNISMAARTRIEGAKDPLMKLILRRVSSSRLHEFFWPDV